jgi:hypothetical protein
MIDLDLVRERMTLLHPRGSVQLSVERSPAQLRADYLYWDNSRQMVELKGHITLDDPLWGKVVAEEQLWITSTSVKTKGATLFAYTDSLARLHTLQTEGEIFLDQEAGRGKIAPAPSQQPLRYQMGEVLTVRAASGSIEYVQQKGRLVPAQILLEEGVELHSKEEGGSERHALADRLSYVPETGAFVLSAKPGERVLFVDTASGAHLSAPEVQIARDPATGKEEFKGIGSVHFAFTPEEESRIRSLFTQE